VASVANAEFFLKEITAHPNWSPKFSVLLDLQQLDTEHLETSEIRGISDMFKAFRKLLGTGCCAVVISSTLGYGLARMWQAMTEDDIRIAIRVFPSLSEAQSWIRDDRQPD
jgi:hypothetical protein